MVADDALMQQCATAYCACKMAAMLTQHTSELTYGHLIGWNFEHLLQLCCCVTHLLAESNLKLRFYTCQRPARPDRECYNIL